MKADVTLIGTIENLEKSIFPHHVSNFNGEKLIFLQRLLTFNAKFLLYLQNFSLCINKEVLRGALHNLSICNVK